MNPYQKYVSEHWKKSKSWKQNMKDIAEEWNAHKKTTTKKRVVHHRRVIHRRA